MRNPLMTCPAAAVIGPEAVKVDTRGPAATVDAVVVVAGAGAAVVVVDAGAGAAVVVVAAGAVVDAVGATAPAVAPAVTGASTIALPYEHTFSYVVAGAPNVESAHTTLLSAIAVMTRVPSTAA
jgi:hypothetical protein